MSWVPAFDAVALCGCTAGLLFLVWRGKGGLHRSSRLPLAVCLAIYAFIALSDLLEHGMGNDLLGRYEEYVEILFVPFFLFFLFSLEGRRELDRCERAEGALRESEQRFRHLAEMLPEIVYETDAEGVVTFVNRQALEKTGYTEEDLHRGFQVLDFVVPEDRERVRRNVAALFRGQGGVGFEYTAVRKDGSRFPILAYSARFLRDGQPAGLRGILVDASRAKNLEAQLAQAQKMEAIGTLAGGIAHDFNNILQSIAGYLELVLANGSLSGDDRARLEKADTACVRAADLVRGLLTFSRRQEPRFSAVDLNREVEQVVAMLERTIPRMIAIETDLEADLWPVRGDRVQIGQILLNLGANASDAIHAEGRITIRTENAAAGRPAPEGEPWPGPGRFVRLTFADSGHGMDAGTVAQIFDPFFTTKAVGQGTGLGLAIAYGIVQSHSGQIRCRSAPGQGTTFVLDLPAIEPGATEAVAQAEVPTAAGPGRTGTVLVVDDEPSVLETAREALEASGWSVIAARSGEEAVAAYAKDPDAIGVVALDLGMPGMGGAGCFEQIRSIRSTARVLVASGYAAEALPADTRGREVDGFLVKPYRLELLVEKVGELLKP